MCFRLIETIYFAINRDGGLNEVDITDYSFFIYPYFFYFTVARYSLAAVYLTVHCNFCLYLM